MSTVHLLIGVPGSGKSTYAKKLSKEINAVIISTDVVRKLHPDWDESLIWPTVYEMCAKSLINERDVIFDATNITPKVRTRFIDSVTSYFTIIDLKEHPFLIGAYYFDIDPSICKKRVIKRNQKKNALYLPPEVVLSYGEKIVPPTEEEKFAFIKRFTIEDEEMKNVFKK